MKQLRQLDLTRAKLEAWRVEVMNVWEKHGHDRLQIRALAMDKAIPYAPAAKGAT